MVPGMVRQLWIVLTSVNFVSFDNYRSICKENTKQEQANINCEFDWTTRVINNIRP